MFEIKNKIKTAIKEQSTPLTAEKARMIAITGSNCTPEQRMQQFIKGLNNIIRDKVRYEEFYLLVVVPEDLYPTRDIVIKDFKDRGFIIHEVTPENKEIFVISWKYNE